MRHALIPAFALSLVVPAAAADFPGGELVVADLGIDVVTRLASDGTSAGAIGSAVTTPDPIAVAFGPDGKLYVASLGLDNVTAFDEAGVAGQQFAHATLVDPSALAFDARGNLLVASRANDLIVVFDAAGTKIGEIKTKVTDPSQLNAPNALAVGPDGHVYTVDGDNNVVYEFDPSSALVRTQQIGCGSGANMRGIAVGWDGHVFVCCSDDNRVKELDATLSLLTTIGDGTTAVMQNPSALAFGADGLLYVASTGRIDRFDRTGAKVDSIASGGAISDPSALAFAPWRFGVELKGSIDVDGGDTFKVKEKFNKNSLVGPVLSIHPGSGVIHLTLVDSADPEDFADVLGTTVLCFHGTDAVPEPSGKVRHFAGFGMSDGTLFDGALAIGIEATGKTSATDGVFRPKTLKGEMLSGAGAATVRLSLTSVKRLNG